MRSVIRGARPASRAAGRAAIWIGRGVALAAPIAFCGCALLRGNPPAAPDTASVPAPVVTRPTGDDRPTLAVIEREGDARAAVGVAVSTEGIAPDRGATVGVALAALAESRLSARGIAATATGGSAGFRLDALIETPADGAAFIDALRVALFSPVAGDDPALPAVLRKTAALARLAPVGSAAVGVPRCTGEAFASGSMTPPSAAELEAWRAAAHGLGRVAVAVAGQAPFADAAVSAISHGGPWPRAAAIVPEPWPAPSAGATVYDASGTLTPGSAQVTVIAMTAAPERAVVAASSLGEARGALASRLGGLDAPARLTSIVATAHAYGGCLAVTIDLGARDLAADAPARIATAAALAREEVAVEIAETAPADDIGRQLTARATDPREAAERAAWWSLAGPRPDMQRDAFVTELFVAVAAPRDSTDVTGGRTETIRTQIDRATLAWHAPVVEPRARVERGQGDVWLVLGSPCGTSGEAAIDAGAGAAVAMAAAGRAALQAGDAHVEPFASADGFGVVVHGPARPGESPLAQARRLGDLAGRAFAAEPLDPNEIARARSSLLADTSTSQARVLTSLAGALSPGHPSWIVPAGTAFGHASASNDSVALRAATVRAGPLRVAVVANADTGQADAAVRAVDRWIARRPGESRACPVAASAAAPRPGTYAVDRTPGVSSEALLGFALPGDDAVQAPATWLAAALSGEDGLLARALGAQSRGRDAALAQTWDATVLGASHARALVVRIVAGDESLDAAVAQVRVLLDRVRQGALTDDDVRRATSKIEAERLAATLDPRSRVLALWRGRPEGPETPPAADAVRALAAQTLRDGAMVIVAARPPRVAPEGPRSTSGPSKAK
ncbi:MAG: hypothetical protein FWD17_10470 [Polyangiaceae bacterium]|nr:hypothetical protein [Polyangiaceae bacterium]